MVAPDKFFEVLLVDGAIMYNVFDTSTSILDITYRDVSYTCDLSEFSSSFPDRRRYTLQTCGLYLFACQKLALDLNLSYDVVAGNYLIFKQKNMMEKSDLLSLLLISVPSFLLPVLSQSASPSIKMTGTATGWNYKNEGSANISPTSSGETSTVTILLVVLVILVIITLMYIIYHKKE